MNGEFSVHTICARVLAEALDLCEHPRALCSLEALDSIASRDASHTARTRERRVVCTALIALGALFDRLVPPAARANTPLDAAAAPLHQLVALAAARQRLAFAAARSDSALAACPFPPLLLPPPPHTCGAPFVPADDPFQNDVHWPLPNSFLAADPNSVFVKPHDADDDGGTASPAAPGGYSATEAEPTSEDTMAMADDAAEPGLANDEHVEDEADEKALSELSGSDSASSARRRRARTNFTSGQMLELEKAFITCHYPDLLAREAIAARLRLPESRVQVFPGFLHMNSYTVFIQILHLRALLIVNCTFLQFT